MEPANAGSTPFPYTAMEVHNIVRRIAICGLAVVAIAGCGADPSEGASKPAATFSGKPDKTYVGAWTTDDGKSTYTFKEDGSYDFSGKVTTQGGTFDNKFSGQWAVDGDRMLFKDPQGNVVPYSLNYKDGVLKLTLTGSMKRETVLKRK